MFNKIIFRITFLLHVLCLPLYAHNSNFCSMDLPIFNKKSTHNLVENYILSENKTRTYLNSITLYRNHAEKKLEEAEELCWYLPNMDARQHLLNAINGAMAGVLSKNTAVITFSAVSNVILQYFNRCVETYCEINDKIKLAKYAYEVAESFENEMIRLQNLPRYID